MGLLDDAIREHLELKRQHGADPDEVSRQEREALGATRKAEFAKTADGDDERSDVEAEAGVADPEAEAPEPIAEAPEPVAEEPEADLEPEPAADPEPAPAGGREPEPEPGGAPFDVESIDPPREPEASEAGYEEDPWLADERDEVPAGDSLEHPRAEPDRPGEEEQESEDVLEETPDFLQETPEHDRLWFEQRPPRDFDWDK